MTYNIFATLKAANGRVEKYQRMEKNRKNYERRKRKKNIDFR